MIMHFCNLVSATLVAVGLVSAAGQASAADSGGYIGFSAGQSKADLNGNEIDASLASIGLGSSTSVDDSDFGFKLYGGYQFKKKFLLEGGYIHFGEFNSHNPILSCGSGTLGGEWKTQTNDIFPLGG